MMRLINILYTWQLPTAQLLLKSALFFTCLPPLPLFAKKKKAHDLSWNDVEQHISVIGSEVAYALSDDHQEHAILARFAQLHNKEYVRRLQPFFLNKKKPSRLHPFFLSSEQRRAIIFCNNPSQTTNAFKKLFEALHPMVPFPKSVQFHMAMQMAAATSNPSVAAKRLDQLNASRHVDPAHLYDLLKKKNDLDRLPKSGLPLGGMVLKDYFFTQFQEESGLKKILTPPEKILPRFFYKLEDAIIKKKTHRIEEWMRCGRFGIHFIKLTNVECVFLETLILLLVLFYKYTLFLNSVCWAFWSCLDLLNLQTSSYYKDPTERSSYFKDENGGVGFVGKRAHLRLGEYLGRFFLATCRFFYWLFLLNISAAFSFQPITETNYSLLKSFNYIPYPKEFNDKGKLITDPTESWIGFFIRTCLYRLIDMMEYNLILFLFYWLGEFEEAYIRLKKAYTDWHTYTLLAHNLIHLLDQDMKLMADVKHVLETTACEITGNSSKHPLKTFFLEDYQLLSAALELKKLKKLQALMEQYPNEPTFLDTMNPFAVEGIKKIGELYSLQNLSKEELNLLIQASAATTNLLGFWGLGLATKKGHKTSLLRIGENNMSSQHAFIYAQNLKNPLFGKNLKASTGLTFHLGKLPTQQTAFSPKKTDKQGVGALVSGTTCSGKTMGMRNLLLNMMLLKSYHVFFGERFGCGVDMVASYNNLTDSSEKSLFETEAKAMKALYEQVVYHSQEGRRVFAPFDEVFFGCSKENAQVYTVYFMKKLIEACPQKVITLVISHIVELESEIERQGFSDRVCSWVTQMDHKGQPTYAWKQGKSASHSHYVIKKVFGEDAVITQDLERLLGDDTK